MTHKGKITISRWSGQSTTGISIELKDESSGVELVRIELTPEALGNAITGLSFQDCTFELGHTELAGMSHEHKTEMVPIEGYSFDDKQKAAAVKPFEVDGWKAYLPDIGNGHRHVKGGYNVTFHRYVPRKEAV